MARDYSSPPWGLRWRSSSSFIVGTVAVGLFTDLFLYGLVVPVLPFMLRDRIDLPQSKVQTYTSGMLAAYAGASCVFSVPAGWIADHTNSRQAPFLAGLAACLAATVMLGVGQSIEVLLLARVLQGVSAAVVWTVGFALVLDTVGPENLGKAIGSILSFISIGELTAPVLGGILYDKTGYIGVFGLSAGLLGIDFIMRLLVIEKKVATRYEGSDQNAASNSSGNTSTSSGDGEDGDANEEDALLPKDQEQQYKIPDGQNRVVKAFPLLYCLSNIRLLMAFTLALVHAILLSAFDATIPTEAEKLFGFSSLQSGLLFIALDIPYIALGTVSGWAVDKYGTKPASVIGYGYLAITLALLRLPSSQITHGKNNLILYCAILALNGVGMAIVGSPSLVEASDVVLKYHKANPDFFGESGPYAQLYGFDSLFFSLGHTIGPILGGTLRDYIGYGNQNAVLAAISFTVAVLSVFIIGGKPKFLTRGSK